MSDSSLKFREVPIFRPRHWLIVVEDGRYMTLNRVNYPDEKDLKKAVAHLDRMGLAGWLAARDRAGYSFETAPLIMVHLITKKTGDWSAAEKRIQCRLAEI